MEHLFLLIMSAKIVKKVKILRNNNKLNKFLKLKKKESKNLNNRVFLYYKVQIMEFKKKNLTLWQILVFIKLLKKFKLFNYFCKINKNNDGFIIVNRLI